MLDHAAVADQPTGPHPMLSAFETVYLAGPMSGYDRYNIAAFKTRASYLREQGFFVVSPVELDEKEGIDYDEAVTPEQYRAFLLRDLIAILEYDVDAIMVLDGWRESKGAALEVHVARTVGIPIYDEHFAPVKEPTKYRPPSDENVLEAAERLVGGDRGAEYGHPLDDFSKTALIMTALLQKELKPGAVIRPDQIPLMMIGVKLSRLVATPGHRDSIIDIAGYDRCLEMVLEEQERRAE